MDRICNSCEVFLWVFVCEFQSVKSSQEEHINIFSPSSQEYPSCVNIVDGFSHDAPERLLHPEPSIIDRLVWRTCLPREARLRPWPPDQRRGEPPGALGHCQREDDRLKSRTPQSRRHYGIAIWWVLWPPWLPQPFCPTDSRVERRDLLGNTPSRAKTFATAGNYMSYILSLSLFLSLSHGIVQPIWSNIRYWMNDSWKHETLNPFFRRKQDHLRMNVAPVIKQSSKVYRSF